jgi:hypothetical protein
LATQDNYPRHLRLSLGAAVLVGSLGLVGCRTSYRVGDYVLVNWCEGQYPAYIVAQRGRARYRVHFDGYDSRWDTEIAYQDVRQRLEEPPRPPPPLCPKVALALGVLKPEASSANPYREGSRVKVTWRGSVYRATVVEVVGTDQLKVHYDGTEAFLDEVIDRSRVVEAP